MSLNTSAEATIGADLALNNTISQIKELPHVERIGAHSHIRGLKDGEGMVGQQKARKAAALVAAMIKEGRIGGRAVLIAGQPGTGKSAIALGMSHALSDDVLFNSMSASEVFSIAVSKTEALTQAIRKSIAVRIREITEVIEGEVVEISVDRAANFSAANALMKTGRIVLRTTDMEAVYELGGKMIDALAKEKVFAGDVVCIDKASGRITKQGRAFSRAKDFDAAGGDVRYAATPEGELQKRRETLHVVSLHDLDVVNSRSAGGFHALFSGDTGEIAAEVRDAVDVRVAQWREEHKCDVVPGVLFIDEVHMLDVECFSFLNRCVERELAPLLIIASNRGMARIRGTTFVSPHGIPADFLDRVLIIATEPYSAEDIRRIVSLRAAEEDVALADEALTELTQIGASASLRYALQLIATANVCRLRRKAARVERTDVCRVSALFHDAKRSCAHLAECGSTFLYNTPAIVC